MHNLIGFQPIEYRNFGMKLRRSQQNKKKGQQKMKTKLSGWKKVVQTNKFILSKRFDQMYNCVFRKSTFASK